MAENKKTALLEGVSEGLTSAEFTTTKTNADSASLTINISVEGKIRTYFYIDTNSNEIVDVERGKYYIVICNTGLPYLPLWWLNRSFGYDKDFTVYTDQHYILNETKGEFPTTGIGRYVRLQFKVNIDAALGHHTLYFNNKGFAYSYAVWNDDANRMETPNIHGRKIITFNVV